MLAYVGCLAPVLVGAAAVVLWRASDRRPPAGDAETPTSVRSAATSATTPSEAAVAAAGAPKVVPLGAAARAPRAGAASRPPVEAARPAAVTSLAAAVAAATAANGFVATESGVPRVGVLPLGVSEAEFSTEARRHGLRPKWETPKRPRDDPDARSWASTLSWRFGRSEDPRLRVADLGPGAEAGALPPGLQRACAYSYGGRVYRIAYLMDYEAMASYGRPSDAPRYDRRRHDPLFEGILAAVAEKYPRRFDGFVDFCELMSYDPYGPSGGVPSLVGAFASPLREELGGCFTEQGGTTRFGPRVYDTPARVGASDAGVAAAVTDTGWVDVSGDAAKYSGRIEHRVTVIDFVLIAAADAARGDCAAAVAARDAETLAAEARDRRKAEDAAATRRAEEAENRKRARDGV